MMQTTSAKSVTPSISAAAMIIEVRMSPVAAGWRAVPSIAAAARRPMPKPAPRTASPAPRPAARYPSENWFIGSTSHYMNALSLGGEEWHVVAGYGPEAASSPARVAAKTSMRVLRHPDEQSREHGEHVGLHQRDEDLEHEDA